MPALRWSVVVSMLALALVAPAATTAAAAQPGTCHATTYSYAGLESRVATRGAVAAIAPTAAPAVRDGHVAGWVGVGGYGVGPGGADEWVQIGLIAFPNRATRIYYEMTRPGKQPVQTIVRDGVVAGERHRFGVFELGRRPNWWRVWLDGRPVGDAVFLPRSHGRFTAQITGESYAGLSEGQCNAYSFSFRHVSLAERGASLSRFADPNYVLERRSATSFVARSTSPAA